ncbi:MAG: M61 family metallopeptidase [Asticcacaulis sp.]|uniref:M61 family metallopeptidase n=1 Tax=Asticcacaulis sp. TaxID=1872648 RepID=UPI003F7CD22B
MYRLRTLAGVSLGVLMMAGVAVAQDAPKWAPMPAPIPAAQNIPYNGTIQLSVDLTDTVHRLVKVHEVIPAKPGPLTLLVPKWLPGDHEPDGEVSKMAGFTFSAGGKPLNWTRDVVEVNAFHVDVPEGANSVTVEFQYLAPVDDGIGRIVMTPDMANLQWDFASIYPAGYYVSRIPVQATLTLPEGWQQGSGLDVETTNGDAITFKTVSYETLIDSPVFAGKYFKRIDLDPGAATPVHMDIVADKPSSLDVSDKELQIHRNLVQQAYKLYGAHHYDHYDFLVAASDKLGGIGLEHHRSSENSVDPDYFTDWDKSFYGRDLFAHEYTHSWNGKYRRPWDLWTPDYQAPMRDSLLWVYEGQTEYWGNVLAARSGLYDRDQYLGHIAMIAAYYDNLAARQWRDLQDTTNDPIIAERAAQSWPNWQASEEYYDEGLLIWLDADTLIREKTGGKKSLDDFAKAFFGVNNGAWDTLTYNFDDVVAALNKVYPYDWASFLNDRLHDHGKAPPFDGLTRAGYKLVYTDTPTSYFKARETYHKMTDFNYSLGFSVSKTGAIINVLWDSPAFKAGLTKGMKLIAVNGLEFDADNLKDVVKADAKTSDKIDLLIKADDRYKTVSIDYHGGLRYPSLVRIDGTKDMLGDIIAAKK